MVFIPLLLAGAAATLAGCAAVADSSPGDTREVVTSFYPLQFVAERVGGRGVTVRNLTKPGAEPHDLELSPRDVADLGDADVVVYLSGFQPAVDTAVDQEADDTGYDVGPAARLDAKDPHFWLDPTRLADVAGALADRLAEVDPAGAADFRRNAAALRADLAELDTEMSQGLADCASTDLVTSHNAFGYLANRYGLTQRGITGLTPEDEPAPGDLARVADFVEANDVRTIYHEALVSPAIAATLARETGARSALLDPLEGLDASSPGSDYLEVMRANLASLRKGQACR